MKKLWLILLIILLVSNCGTHKNASKIVKNETSKLDTNQILNDSLLVFDLDSSFEKLFDLEELEYDRTGSGSGSGGSSKHKEKKVERKTSSRSSQDNKSKSTQSTDKNGQLLYSLPDTMKVGISYHVIVRIANTRNDVSITEGLPSVNEVVAIRTSSTMQVEMIDADKAFSVSPSGAQIQIVDSIEYTEWVFDVKPINSGRHPLNIVASIITPDGRKDKTYSNTIFVKMNIVTQTKSFWETEWKWVFTTLIIPLIGWWYKNRKKKSDAS